MQPVSGYILLILILSFSACATSTDSEVHSASEELSDKSSPEPSEWVYDGEGVRHFEVIGRTSDTASVKIRDGVFAEYPLYEDVDEQTGPATRAVKFFYDNASCTGRALLPNQEVVYPDSSKYAGEFAKPGQLLISWSLNESSQIVPLESQRAALLPVTATAEVFEATHELEVGTGNCVSVQNMAATGTARIIGYAVDTVPLLEFVFPSPITVGP